MRDEPPPLAIRHEADLAAARRELRAAALRIGLAASRTEALATAATEIARNMLDHAGHGTMTLAAIVRDARPGLELVLRDTGPGIPDLQQAMEDGFTTRGSLGLGLPGARALVDEFEIASRPGRGTTVVLRQFAPTPVGRTG